MKQRKYILSGGILALIAVILGALASHALKSRLDTDGLSSFRTAVRFQFYHALALLALAAVLDFLKSNYHKWILYAMLSGTILFSFSIYGLILLPLAGIKAHWLGPVTPLGGFLLIAAWTMVVTAALRKKEA